MKLLALPSPLTGWVLRIREGEGNVGSFILKVPAVEFSGRNIYYKLYK